MTEQSAPTNEPPGELEIFRNTLTDLLDTPPHILASLSFAESTVKEINANQVLGELLSNARDAVAQAAHKPRTLDDLTAEGVDRARRTRARVRVELTPDAVVIANDGHRLNRGGYNALTSLGSSAKKDRAPGGGLLARAPGAVRTLGRHGIGWKSVLAVSDRPQVFGNTAGEGRFAIEMGAPRVRDLCEALAQQDRAACEALLTDAEREVFAEVLAPPCTLDTRSLTTLLGTRGVVLEDLLARLPITPFPLWVHEVPERVATLLGWAGEPPNDKPFDTVIRLPLRESDAAQILATFAAQFQQAQQVFLGIQASVRLFDHTQASDAD